MAFNVAVNGKFCAAEKEEGVLRIAGSGAGSGGSKHLMSVRTMRV